MMEKILEIINIILENKGKEKVDSINTLTNLRDDLGFDSMDLAELTVRIEDEFDIDIFEDGLISTVGEIYAKLEK